MLRGLVGWLQRSDAVLHLHAFGALLVWPLLGVAATAPQALEELLLPLIVISLAFNSFGYMLNDVVDLDVDRTNPLRQDSLLVKGMLGPRQVLALALALVPAMAALHVAFGLAPGALPYLFAAIAAMAAYDVWGKRCPIPLVVDAVLGLSGAAMVLYGAAVSGGSWSRATLLVAVSAAVFAMFVNAFLNDLRDLPNDVRQGVRRTAAFLGSRPVERGRYVSPVLGLYCLVLQGILLVAAFVAGQDSGTLPGPTLPLLIIVGAAQVVAYLALLRLRDPHWQFVARLHGASLPAPMLIALAPLMGATTLLILAPIYLLPGLLLAKIQEGLRSLPGVRRTESLAG